MASLNLLDWCGFSVFLFVFLFFFFFLFLYSLTVYYNTVSFLDFRHLKSLDKDLTKDCVNRSSWLVEGAVTGAADGLGGGRGR